MGKIQNVAVLCADRDNDLGRKAKIEGPVIGRKENLKAAAKLAVADPEESDANCMFAAVRKFDEVKKHYANVEIATLTGYGKSDFESDKRLNEQLDAFLENFHAEGFVLVTDGAEDDQIIPILQSRAKIISKETVIIKQAKEIEGTYYAIKEAIKDPTLALIVFGIPGIILLLIASLPSIGLQLAVGGIGAFLLLYGFGIYDAAVSTVRSVTSSISVQRTSFPLYIAVILLFVFGIYSGYTEFITGEKTADIIARTVDAIMQVVNFTMLSAISFALAKSVDAVHFRMAYMLRKYFLSIVYVAIIWLILDSGRNVFVGVADLNLFLFVVIVSFGAAILAYYVSSVFDVRGKITRLLVGLPVYSREGKWLGRVTSISASKDVVEYIPLKEKEAVKLRKKDLTIGIDKVIVAA